MQGACKKDADDVIDCIVEGLFVNISHTEDPSSVKKINFVANYSGEHSVKSVKWTFGDGVTENGNTTISHVYTTAGPYTVKADVLIVSGRSTCTPMPTKNITVK